MKYSKPVFLVILCSLLIIPFTAQAQLENERKKLSKDDSIEITVHKRPNCRCCTKWADYLDEQGFTVNQMPNDTLQAVKDHYLVPEKLQSCHTAIVDGYVIEGHVPAESIRKLLNEQPEAQGISVPNMPTGTPGMGSDGTPFEVYLFDKEGDHSLYQKY